MTKTRPINISRIDHIVLRVKNLDRMVRFYTEVLGCPLERGPGDERLAQLRAGDSLIDLVDIDSELGRLAGDPPDHNAPNMDHVCLLVEPWDEVAIIEYLRAHSVAPGTVEPRYGATGVGPSMYFKDPEGNTVELKGRS